MPRLVNALQGLVVAGLVTAVFFLVATVVRLVTGRKIGSPRYYNVAIFGGFLLYVALMAVLPPSHTTTVNSATHGAAPVTQNAGGLDAPFAPPDEDHLEQFPVLLNQAIERLPEQQRVQVTTAVTFLSFAAAANLAEQDPTKFRGASDSDLVALGSLASAATRRVRAAP